MKYDSIKENYERGKNWSKDKEWGMNRNNIQVI